MATVIEEPSWWDSSTVVEISTVSYGATQCNRVDVDLLTYGVSIPATNSAAWAAQLIPWGIVANVHFVS